MQQVLEQLVEPAGVPELVPVDAGNARKAAREPRRDLVRERIVDIRPGNPRVRQAAVDILQQRIEVREESRGGGVHRCGVREGAQEAKCDVQATGITRRPDGKLRQLAQVRRLLGLPARPETIADRMQAAYCLASRLAAHDTEPSPLRAAGNT